MKKRTKAVIIVCAVLLLTVTALVFFFRQGYSQLFPKKGYGLFSWEETVIEETEWDSLSACIDQTGVTEVYQCFEAEGLLDNASGFVSRLHGKGVAVYALMGNSEWAYEADGASIIYQVKRVAEYNNAQGRESRIKGVMVDVEPYLLSEWDEGGDARTALMSRYLLGMSSAYEYASQNNLEFWVCIPTFLERNNKEILEALIARSCDGVAVMNYNRTDEYGQMAMELGFAREYGKKIICIFELQEPGNHSLEDIHTYANQGLDALHRSAERLEKQFGYDGLHFAYHYYKPLRQMLGLDGQEAGGKENTP